MHEQTLTGMEPPGQPVADHRGTIAEIDREIAALGPEVDPAVSQVELDGLAGNLADAERLREQTQIALNEAQREEAAAKARLDQSLSTVPVELRQREALERHLADKRLRHAERMTAFEIAMRTKDETAIAALVAERDVLAAVETHQDAVGRRDTA